MSSVPQNIELFFIWSINGLLVTAFWLVDHIFPLAALPAFALLISRAPREQRPFGLAAALAGLLTAIFVPQPIPLILLAMVWGGIGAVALDRFNPDTLRWRVIGGIALYAIASIAWTGYSAYVATLSPGQWGSMLASDEAASTIAQGRSFLQTISVWGLWIILPLGYFSLLLQGLFVHPPLTTAPADVIHTVRGRGEPVRTQNPGQGASLSWLPWRNR
jgi:hypothetical protein